MIICLSFSLVRSTYNKLILILISSSWISVACVCCCDWDKLFNLPDDWIYVAWWWEKYLSKLSLIILQKFGKDLLMILTLFLIFSIQICIFFLNMPNIFIYVAQWREKYPSKYSLINLQKFVGNLLKMNTLLKLFSSH